MNKCRNCGDYREHPIFCDLGYQPLANSYLTVNQLAAPEVTYPLVPFVCQSCGLVQLPSFMAPSDIFSEYAYFSSQSGGWITHLEEFAEMIIPELGLSRDSRVLEIASNDGALLRIMRENGIPALGIEPAVNIALVAQLDGLATIPEFMGVKLASKLTSNGYKADLVVANNVVAHVPDLDDFIAGISIVIADSGTLVLEFPDVENLISENQFDTIYHEHFSYFSLQTITNALSRRGFTVYDHETLPTHGGSLRIYARRNAMGRVQPGSVSKQYVPERYLDYAPVPSEFKRAFIHRLADASAHGKRIVGYGAPAKGNTILNYCGVKPDLMEYVVDSTPAKQGKYLPGSRIPVRPISFLGQDKPDVIVIMPWNWTDEIVKKLKHARQWGATILSRLDEV